MAKLSDEVKDTLLKFEKKLGEHIGEKPAEAMFKDKPVLNELLHQTKNTTLEVFIFLHDLALSNIRKAKNQSGKVASKKRKEFQDKFINDYGSSLNFISRIELVANLGAKGRFKYDVKGTDEDAVYNGYGASKIFYSGRKPERTKSWSYAGYRFEQHLSFKYFEYIKE